MRPLPRLLLAVAPVASAAILGSLVTTPNIPIGTRAWRSQRAHHPTGGALADADLLDDVGSGRLTPDEAQTISAIVAKRTELFASVELAAEIEGAPRRCRRHPPPSTDPPPCRDRLIDTLAVAPHEASSLAVGMKWRGGSVSFTSIRRHPTVVARLFRLWDSCWDGLYWRGSVGTMRRLIIRF